MHGKTLYVVAHSMGGLIARWFIEREGGKEVVQHLVMVGTPNADSPWSNVQDWATVALGVALNGLSLVPWTAQVLSGLVTLIEKVDVTLDQMHTNSSFIKELGKSLDLGIPYTILPGKASIRVGGVGSDAAGNTIIRLLQKLQVKRRFCEAVTLGLFGAEPPKEHKFTSQGKISS